MEELTLDDIRIALSEMGVKADMPDDEFEMSSFQKDLKMDKIGVLMLIEALESIHNIFLPSGLEMSLSHNATVGMFIKSANRFKIDRIPR